jgi:hypothetical protein
MGRWGSQLIIFVQDRLAPPHHPKRMKFYTTLYYTILYYTILYYTILYYTILYYTILYYTTVDYTSPSPLFPLSPPRGSRKKKKKKRDSGYQ